MTNAPHKRDKMDKNKKRNKKTTKTSTPTNYCVYVHVCKRTLESWEASRIVFARWKTSRLCAHTRLHTQQHKHTRTERSHIWSARHKIGSWPSVLPWKPCQMLCCDLLILYKRGTLMKLVSLYEKWDRKWNSLGGFHSLPSSGYLSAGFSASF